METARDTVDRLIVPEALLPGQEGKRADYEDLRLFYAAILFDAVQCLTGKASGISGGDTRYTDAKVWQARARHNEQIRAREWFEHPHRNYHVNLALVCQVLELDIARIQRIVSEPQLDSVIACVRACMRVDRQR